MSEVEIVPAILSKRFRDIEQQLAIVHGEVRRVQIDVVDGTFARPKTWPYTDKSTFDDIVQGNSKFPYWDELMFEYDLMVSQPLVEAREFVRMGATRIVLHAHSEQAAEAFQSLIDMRDDEGDSKVAVGIALMPTDQPDLLEPFEAQFDFVQVMGIDRIGRQGEPLDHHAVFLVERLRRRYPQLSLQVDGGVNKDTIPALVHAGANHLIVGSAIFDAKDPVAAYHELLELANQR